MFRSLQVRLLVLLILFSVIPALVLGISLGIYSAGSARQSVEDMLNAIATIKENQVNQWAVELQNSLESEIQRDVDAQRLPILLGKVITSPAAFEAAHNDQVRLFNTSITARADFVEIFLIDVNGIIVASTRSDQEGKSFSFFDVFRQGLQAPSQTAPSYDFTAEQITVQFARPVKDITGQTIGVLAARATIRTLNELMKARIGIGETGETYLVSRNLILLSQTRLAGNVIGEDYSRTEGAEQAIFTQQPGVATYLNYAGEPVIGSYRWIPSLQVALLAEQTQSEALASVNLITTITIVALVVSIVLAVLAAYLVSNNLTRPITRLTLAAENITSSGTRPAIGTTGEAALPTADALGRLSTQIDTTRQDEIGALGKAFRAMTLELRNLIRNLEGRVEERTRLLQARSDQLQAAAEVSRSVATILDTDQLIQQVVELIQQRFELYYVGLFLTDQAREWAVLKAGTGQAGRAMLARQHRIKIGAGMIGWSIANAQARIALEAAEDAVRLVSSDLPDTRSEAAIPLRSRGQVLGAISVQSRLPHAFDGEVISVFQTMADQIAVAIDNARLFAESQQALDSVQQAYGRMSHQAWLERISARPIAYKRDQTGLVRLDSMAGPGTENRTFPESVELPVADTESGKTDHTLTLFLKARDQVIGQVHLRRSNSPWSEAEVELLQTILDQVGASLDAARLFEETQQRAQRERLVGEITSNMRATLDIDNVLQTAAREMLNTLDLAEVEVRLSSGSERSGSTAGGNANAEMENGQ